MKKILLALILVIISCSSLLAQNLALTSNDWILQDLFINGSSNLPSSITYLTYDVELRFLNSGTDYSFETSVCPGSEEIFHIQMQYLVL
jgi:hypothetical protein